MHLLLMLLFISINSFAYQSAITSSGKKIFWPNPNIPLKVTTNTTDLGSSTATNIIQNSMNQWNLASSAQVYADQNAANELKFSTNFSIYGSAVIGVTELSYDTDGSVRKGTILLNDNYFFTGADGVYPNGTIFLGDVVTHEMGHLFGLGHSEVLDSTMFYTAFAGQSSIAADDKAGITAKYGSSYGKIYGYVKGGNSVGVLGVHVQAISRITGEVIATVSEESGYFEISGLTLNDTYYLYTSPVKRIATFNGTYANAQTAFCPASYVGSFFSACGKDQEGLPQGINITSANRSINVGIVTINCSLKTNEEYSVQKISSTFSPVEIYNYSSAEPISQKAFVGYFQNSSSSPSSADKLTIDLTEYSALAGSTKYLKISLVSQVLGTQLSYNLKVKHNGVYVPAAEKDITIIAPYKVDLETFLTLSPIAANNTFQIEIIATKLSSTDMNFIFPSYETYTNSSFWPYLAVVSLWESSGASKIPIIDTEQVLSDNKECLDAPFTYTVSSANLKGDSILGDKSNVAATSCGTIEPPQGGNGPGASLMLFALGFSLVALISKRHKNFLS